MFLSCLCFQVDCLGLYKESLDQFLEVWQQILFEPDSHTSEILSAACFAVVVAYLQSKLSVPQGSRASNMKGNDTFMFDQGDLTTYTIQLNIIGLIARSVLQQCLPLVVSSFECCLSEYMKIMFEFQQDHGRLSALSSRIDDLHEDLHWMFMISGHMLCNVVDGEEVAIPEAVLEYSSLQRAFTKEVDIQDLVLHCVPGTISSSDADVLVQVIAVGAQWCVIESEMIKQGLFQVLSPQVSESATWFLSIIANPYLMKSKQAYEKVKE